jgi:hypothetical protein
MKRNQLWIAVIVVSFCLHLSLAASSQDIGAILQQKVGALKESIARNGAALRQYTWIEKTELSLKGEVKNTKIVSCKYAPDGSLQKTPLSTSPPPKKGRGLRGKIATKKVGEMQDYMERSVSLIGRYIPPSPDGIQSVVAAGKAGFNQAGPDAIQLIFRDYLKNGDEVLLTLDTAGKVIKQLAVKTYLDEQDKDAISLTVNFQMLPDGTNATVRKILEVAAKEIVVNIEDSNYQKLAQ